MKEMTAEEMIIFLRGMKQQQEILEEEKKILRNSVETLEEAIQRNNFTHHGDESGVASSGFSPDKVLNVLLNSRRDIEEETRNMVCRMRDIYEQEDQIKFVWRCLRQMKIHEQYLLREAYINDVIIEKLGKTLNISKSHLYRQLNKAMDNLLDIYNHSCHQVSSIRAEQLIKDVLPYMPEGSIA